MYAKIFTQIFDSSIADNWKTRHVFEDLLKLADLNGVVDMTREAIAARTRLPLEMVVDAIKELEAPDPRSRTPDANGVRIVRLDGHRDWGWEIVNYNVFRQIASEEQRREKTKLRTRKWRDSKDLQKCDAPVTMGDASDAMQREMEKQKQISEALQKEGSGVELCWKGDGKIGDIGYLHAELCALFQRPKEQALQLEDQHAMGIIIRRQGYADEIILIKKLSSSGEKFPQSLTALVTNWDKIVDRARNYEKHPTTDRKRTDRNAGTYNAGNSSKYARAVSSGKAPIPAVPNIQ